MGGDGNAGLTLREEVRRVTAVAADRAGEQPRLNECQLAMAYLLAEERVREFFRLPLLIRRDRGLPSGFRKFDRPTLPDGKLARFQFSAVEQRKRESLRPRSELLHQIERERLAAGPIRVQVTDERIEPDGGERRNAVVPEQGVEKRQQAIDGIAWGPAVAAIEIESRAQRRPEMQREHFEMERGGAAFDAANDVGIVGRPLELAEQVREMFGDSAQPRGVGFAGSVARAAGEQPAGVVELAGDEAAGELAAWCWARRSRTEPRGTPSTRASSRPHSVKKQTEAPFSQQSRRTAGET